MMSSAHQNCRLYLKEELTMGNRLNGFRFEIHNAPGNMIIELNEKPDGRRSLLCNCNWNITETDITGKEAEFVEGLNSCGIQNLNARYLSPIDYDPVSLFSWGLDCGIDGIHIISGGDVIPDEIDRMVVLLRRFDMSIPLFEHK